MSEQPQGKPTSELRRIVREDNARLDELADMWSELQPYQQRELIETARAMTADAPPTIKCSSTAWVWRADDGLYRNFKGERLHTCPSPEPQSLRA